MFARKRPMNFLFAGPPGHGKTSAARFIIDKFNAADLVLNGSDLRSADAVNSKVLGFASTFSVFGNSKAVFIDEADGMAPAAESILRTLMEKTTGECFFIFCCNDATKLSAGLKSRLCHLSLMPYGDDRPAVMERWVPEYKGRVRQLGIQYDESRLDHLIQLYFPDLRALANQIEFEFC
jgi:DNA polymerase III delta prime subunit